ncbi:glycosyltransferase [Fictibacillus norfolkensis]|uniref:Glycosyltransferase n=1 Tax=Fictibacillus norfolkensis TaxID=2762233 RepID=A0ABR8SN18_9BACL|nr:glycosyltransferase [Fictibacillus norfolkensis]MBD7964908.1 glycosyltransferase [Fictibacillus norfolkensis]
MHVLIVPSWYPTEFTPIAGIFFKEQAKALQKFGHKVTVVFPETRSLKSYNKDFKSGIKCNVEDGIKTYRYHGYNLMPGLTKANKINYFMKFKKLYHHIVEKEGIPNIVHAHSCLWGGWAAAKIITKEHIPLVITEHSTAFIRGLIEPEEEEDIRYALGKASKVISVGPRLAEEMTKYVNENKVTLIPNIVNTDYFTIKKSDNKSFRFFTVSLLTQKKGMDILVKAFANTFKGEKYELIIGGTGEEEANIKKLVDELMISNQVQFLGELSREEVRDQMQSCDAFVLASRFETFGVVYIEALACGKPVIATASGGPEIIVNEKNGLLVPVDDIKNLGNAMQTLVNNKNKYNEELIREDCVKRFSEDVITSQLDNLYSGVIGQYTAK